MDVNSYNDCVKSWADALFRFAYKYIGHTEDARDVVQNCFAVLWQKRNEVPVEKGKSFLFQVAYNQSVDAYRRNGKTVYPETLNEQMEFRNAAQPDLKRVLEKALGQLDEQSRALVLLKDYEGYSYDEIGKITGLSEAQVKVYLHRARKTLKSYLVKLDYVI